MSTARSMLDRLIMEAASLQIAVDEYGEIEGVENDVSLFDLMDERDQVILSLLHYLKEFNEHLEKDVRKDKYKRALQRALETDTVKNHPFMKALRGD